MPYSAIKAGELRYEVGGFVSEIRKEVRAKTRFSEEILKELDQGKLSIKTQKQIWTQIINQSRDCDILLLEMKYPKENFDILVECLRELDVKYKKTLNIFLQVEKLELRARAFAEKTKSPESIPEEEFIDKTLEREKTRLHRIEQIKSTIPLINIDANCSTAELESKILSELEK